MYRKGLEYLRSWRDRRSRKPLVVRGARQVGKTWLVRRFGESCFSNVVEIDFEREMDAGSLFDSKNPVEIISLLQLRYEAEIIPGRTLLFLDEIQASPQVFSVLRYFHELMPELHVIAAGSLLELHFGENMQSIPVGRVEFMYLAPMHFEEFLQAMGKRKLYNLLYSFSVGDTIPGPVHSQLSKLLALYMITGGMPEAVKVFSETGSYRECDMVKQAILSSYSDDFSKYGLRVNADRIRRVFSRLPFLIGQKFKYCNIERDLRARDIAKVVEMLFSAGVASPVFHSSCNGIPLKAEVNYRKFKVIFIDVGLLCRACGLNGIDFHNADSLLMINSGAIAEQFIGQQLIADNDFYEKPELFYWAREKSQSSAEVDYVTAIGNTIIPVEVKAGRTGTLKSMHMFLTLKERSLGMRYNMDFPNICPGTANVMASSFPSLSLETTGISGINTEYRILSLPLYLAGQHRRILQDIL